MSKGCSARKSGRCCRRCWISGPATSRGGMRATPESASPDKGWKINWSGTSSELSLPKCKVGVSPQNRTAQRNEQLVEGGRSWTSCSSWLCESARKLQKFCIRTRGRGIRRVNVCAKEKWLNRDCEGATKSRTTTGSGWWWLWASWGNRAKHVSSWWRRITSRLALSSFPFN